MARLHNGNHDDGTCPSCGTDWESELAPRHDEDGPDYRHSRYFCPVCDRELCDECIEAGIAVKCYGCGRPVCEGCAVLVGDDRYCKECAEKEEREVEEQEIKCQQS